MAKNEITGDTLISKKNSKEFCSGWELIWGKKEPKLLTVDDKDCKIDKQTKIKSEQNV